MKQIFGFCSHLVKVTFCTHSSPAQVSRSENPEESGWSPYYRLLSLSLCPTTETIVTALQTIINVTRNLISNKTGEDIMHQDCIFSSCSAQLIRNQCVLLTYLVYFPISCNSFAEFLLSSAWSSRDSRIGIFRSSDCDESYFCYLAAHLENMKTWGALSPMVLFIRSGE